MELLAYYLLLGAAAGVAAGLLGVGGGLIIVPVLVYLLTGEDVGGEIVIHLAIGTSLATIVFTSISSVWAHQRRGAVVWPVVLRLSGGIVVGAFVAALIAAWIPALYLQRFFGLFELAVAAQMALALQVGVHRELPGGAQLASIGSLIGAVSSLIGIGGGTMTVPYLTWCGVTIRRAIATSAACGLPIAVAGATGFMIQGWNRAELPDGSWGYIYLPALLGIALASVAMAPVGARLAHWLPAGVLKRLFALVLAFLGVRMLLV